MCGLLGGNVAPEILDLETIAHRGPDSRGIETIGTWTLGHTRLAIQDLSSASTQPIRYDGLVVTYNGELWRPDVARRALDGVRFETTGDTEVVARLLERHGADALPMLDGMFALAWSDGESLWLARDPYGEIPLHYGTTSTGALVYGSEVAPLLSCGAVPASIRWVPPGTVIRARGDGRLDFAEWYEQPQPSSDETLRDLLRRGVTGRLTSDAPVALLLSGGLDSAAIATVVAEERANVVAYTAVAYERSNDRRYAREIASTLGIELREIHVPPPTPEALAETVRTIEQPHKAQVEIGYACSHLARAIAADGYRVILTGEGADELFASYGMAYHGIAQHGWDGYRQRTYTGQHRKNFARTNKVFLRHGVEARLPFLEPTLAAYLLARTQAETTLDGRHPKALLASAFEHDLGPCVWRTKAAFQTDARIDRAAKTIIPDPRAYYLDVYRHFFPNVKP